MSGFPSDAFAFATSTGKRVSARLVPRAPMGPRMSELLGRRVVKRRLFAAIAGSALLAVPSIGVTGVQHHRIYFAGLPLLDRPADRHSDVEPSDPSLELALVEMHAADDLDGDDRGDRPID